MSIKFLCIHCKNVIPAKDEYAGKKAKCPHCQKIITVPVPTRPATPPKAAPPLAPEAPKAAPPPRHADLEAEAAAVLGDEPKAEQAATATIDFTCPMCDAELHLPLAEAGKRTPCPECKRIIKVPEPEKKDPANWRQTGPSLPSGARRPDQPAPEGAWGSVAAAATVSREALQDAGAIPEARAFLTVRQRVVRYTLWSAGAVAVLTLLAVAYVRLGETKAEQAVESAVAYADSDAGKKELGAGGRAAVYRLAGEFSLKSRPAGAESKAHRQFLNSLGAARETAGAERDALLQDVAASVVGLGGADGEKDADLERSWDEVQKVLRAALGEIQSPEARLDALREVARRLADAGQGERAAALAHSLYSSAGADQAEALGVVGLELLAAKQKDLAEKALTQAAAPYANEKDRPVLAPSMVALALALGVQPPGRSKKQAVADERAELLGQIDGLAQSGKLQEARDGIPILAKKFPDLRLPAEASLAAAALGDKAAGHGEVDQALSDAQQAQGASPWLLLRLCRIGARAGSAPDAIRATAGLIQDPALRGRAQLAALDAQLSQSKQAVDAKAMDAVEAQTVANRLAHAEWARRTPGAAGVVKGWDAPKRAFGQLGVALGHEGSD